MRLVVFDCVCILITLPIAALNCSSGGTVNVIVGLVLFLCTYAFPLQWLREDWKSVSKRNYDK